MKTILLTKEEFIELIDERLNQALSKITVDENTNQEEEILNRYDLVKLFGVSLVTINDWCKKGILIPHHMNSRVYFYKSEVMGALENKKYGGPKS